MNRFCHWIFRQCAWLFTWPALLLLPATARSVEAEPAASMTVSHLRCEDLADPLGIDALSPRLSWILAANERGARQTAYRVLVASRLELLQSGRADRWDSGKVASDQSILIPYGGSVLKTGDDCWWQVQAWDAQERPTPWSEPAHWSMGLLHPADWTGEWIGFDEHLSPAPLVGARWIWTKAVPPPPNIDQMTRYFRGTIELPAGAAVRSGRLIAVASGVMVASINGVRLRLMDGLAPNFAQEVDLAWRLKPGPNVVALSLQPEPSPGLPPGIVARIEVTLMDGRTLSFASDGHWKASAFPNPGWERLGYDDSAWSPAEPSAAAGGAPWGPLLRPASRRLPARWLRREFPARGGVRRALVYYSGLGVSELYLNGRKVGDETLSPGLSEIPERAFYVTHEVTALMRAGANALGAVLGNGRYFAPRRGAPFGEVYPKLMLKLVIEYQDGSKDVVTSDRAWQVTDQGPIRANNEYDGEDYDARMELPGWSEPGFVAGGWKPVEAVAPAAKRLSAQMFPPIRVTATLPAVAMRQISPGVMVYDLGQNMVGRCRLRVRGSKGTEVTLRHAETVDADGVPHFENLRTALATDTYILKGDGEETFEPGFATHGFRYVEVRGWPGQPDLGAIEGRVIGDDLEPVGEWTSSNPLLNQIYHNMAWGIRGNYRSIPTDCPQRDERMGWTGDRVFESKGEAFIYDTAPLYRKWFQDMADTQRPDGSLSDVCPSYWPYFNQDVTWAGCFVMAPQGLYEQFGDADFVRLHYAAMRRWVAHLATYAQQDIIPNDRYGDWCPPPENRTMIHTQDPWANPSGSFLATSHFYAVLGLMQHYAERLGRSDDARDYAALAGRVRAAFNQRFLAPDHRRYDTGSQTTFVLPLALGLAPAEARDGLAAELARRIELVDQFHPQTGLVGVQHLMRTLTETGRPDLAYRLAVQETYPSWGYMVRQGATTVWELWDGNTAEVAMNSGNHVMLIGDAVIWLYEDLAGIKSDPNAPGFKHILMQPTPVGDLRSVRASYRSPYGWVRSEWRKMPGRFEWDVTVPANATATLMLPTRADETLTEQGRPLEQAVGIRVGARVGERLTLEAAAGVYHFAAQSGRAGDP